jgi:tetratricopeptide (TPR) repeat protein
MPEVAASSPQPPPRQRVTPPGFLPGLLLLLAATVAVLAPLLKADFIFWDDHEFVTDNAPLARGLTLESLGWALGNNLTFFDGKLEYFSPVTAISRLVDVTLYGPANAAAFHTSSLLIHLGNVVLLAVALWLLTGRPGRALAVAAVFAPHPLIVEPVGWLSARKDLLYGTTFLLALLAYAAYARKPGWRRYLWLSGAVLLACMSKPMAVTLPFCLLLLDIWPLQRLRLGESGFWARAGRLVLEKLPFIALSLGIAVLAYLSQKHYEAIVPVSVFSPWERLGNVLLAYQEYLRMFFAPSDLAPLHRYTYHPGVGETLLRLAVFLGAALYTLLALRRAPYLAVGWFWFVGILLPVSGLVQIGSASFAERYMYVPLIGLAIALVWIGAELVEQMREAKKLDLRPAALTLLAGWIGLGAVQAHQYSKSWQSTGAIVPAQLWSHPDTWRFKKAYVTWLINDGQLGLAWSHLRDFVSAREDLPYAWHYLARIHLALKQEDRAFTAAENALKTGGGADAEALIGFLLARQKRYDEAIPHLEKAVAEAENVTAETRITLVQCYTLTGREEQAKLHFGELVKMAKTDPQAREILERMNLPGFPKRKP